MSRLIALTALVLPLWFGTDAYAAPPPAADFGQHVVRCAQTMGFDGTHNPGMHRGASGWDGMTCQP